MSEKAIELIQQGGVFCVVSFVLVIIVIVLYRQVLGPLMKDIRDTSVSLADVAGEVKDASIIARDAAESAEKAAGHCKIAADTACAVTDRLLRQVNGHGHKERA